jgi:hypothetical protein
MLPISSGGFFRGRANDKIIERAKTAKTLVIRAIDGLTADAETATFRLDGFSNALAALPCIKKEG